MAEVKTGVVKVKKNKVHFTNSVDWGGFFVASKLPSKDFSKKLKKDTLTIESIYDAIVDMVVEFRFYSTEHKRKVLFEFFGTNQLYALRDLLNKTIEDVEAISE